MPHYRPGIADTGDFTFLVEARRELPGGAFNPSLLQAKSSQGLQSPIPHSCVVRGYPTARRPKGFSGLEVSYDTLLAFVQGTGFMREINHCNGRILLQGSQATLELVKRANDLFLWHILDLDSPSHACACQNLPSSEDNDGIFESLYLEKLALQRHIIGNCEGAKGSTGEQNLGIKSSLKKGLSTVDMDGVSFNPSIRSLADSLPGCIMNDDSPEASADSDLLSISSFSEDAPVSPLDPDDILFPIIKAVVNRLLSEFRASVTVRSSHSDGEYLGKNYGASGSTTATPAAATANAPGLSRKRDFSQQGNDDFDEDGSQRPPPKKVKQKQETQQKLLACPFWKLDPFKHRVCFSLRLHGIPRVKQHLTRNHTPTFYCQRCLVIFQDQETHERHVMCAPGNYCTRNPSARLDGISPQQQRELSRKSNAAFSEAEKWFAIWDIVLPGHQRPSSPYVDGQLSEDCSLFQEHCLNHGPEILAQVVEASGALSMAELDEEARSRALRHILRQGFDTIFERWIPPRASFLNIATASSSSSSSGHSNLGNLEVTPGVTPASSFADSGVGLRSHVSGDSSSDTSRRIERVPRVQPDTFTGRRSNDIGGVPAEITTGSSQNHELGISQGIPYGSFFSEAFREPFQDQWIMEPTQGENLLIDKSDLADLEGLLNFE